MNKNNIPADIQADADRLYPKDTSIIKQMNNPLIIDPLRNAYIKGRIDKRSKQLPVNYNEIKTKDISQLTSAYKDESIPVSVVGTYSRETLLHFGEWILEIDVDSEVYQNKTGKELYQLWLSEYKPSKTN